MANTYIRGQQVRLYNPTAILDSTGTPADPATVSVVVTDPAGNTTTYTYASSAVVRDVAAFYHYDLATAGVSDAQLGYWVYAFVTTGNPAAAEKNTFILTSEKTR